MTIPQGLINTAVRFRATGAPKSPVADVTPKFRSADNAAFLAYVAGELAALSKKFGPEEPGFDAGGVGCFGLLGEYGLIGYGIRQAQKLVRVDHLPSCWSHAFLFAQPLSTKATALRDPDTSPFIWESTLEPASLFNKFVDRNGVGPRHIGDYAPADFDLLREHSVPNMAVIAIGMTAKEREAVMERASQPDVDRLRYDISGLLGVWYAFLTNRASLPNPLADGRGIFCSAYVQLAYDAAGIDLAPGAHQRNTSPEHLWQGAKYFSDMYTWIGPEGKKQRPVYGWCVLRDPAGIVAPVNVEFGSLTGSLAEFGGASGRRRGGSGRRAGRR